MGRFFVLLHGAGKIELKIALDSSKCLALQDPSARERQKAMDISTAVIPVGKG
jgi:hypothetical protein